MPTAVPQPPATVLVARFTAQEAVDLTLGIVEDVSPEGPDRWVIGWDEWDTILTRLDLRDDDEVTDLQDKITAGDRIPPDEFHWLALDFAEDFLLTRNAPHWAQMWDGPYEIALSVQAEPPAGAVTQIDPLAAFPVSDRIDLLNRYAGLIATSINAKPDPAGQDISDLIHLAVVADSKTLTLLADHPNEDVRAAVAARIVSAAGTSS